MAGFLKKRKEREKKDPDKEELDRLATLSEEELVRNYVLYKDT